MASTVQMGEILLTDHHTQVPLDWGDPKGTRIDLFFRELCHVSKHHEDLPLLVFLQGGPGGSSPRVSRWGMGWINEALKRYRVILPDQRGTGRSSRVSSHTMQRFSSGEEAGSFLACFDAHAIIADFEHIRTQHYSGKKWTSLGQSYGGFLTLTYLSYAPHALDKCLITGGLPSLTPNADEVYRLTYPRAKNKLQAYYQQFPHDEEIINRLADHIQTHSCTLPNGDPLTVRRLQSLGMMLGMQSSSDALHWLLEEAFSDQSYRELNPHFLAQLQSITGMDTNPLYAVLQENIYAAPGQTAPWAAQRIHDQHPEFDERQRPLLLTGEMIYPWMFDEIRELKAFKEGTHALAKQTPTKPLYDIQRLALNQIPVAAAIYFDDLYVDRTLSLQTAAQVGNLQYWITNELEHDGLRVDATVFPRLHKMLEGC